MKAKAVASMLAHTGRFRGLVTAYNNMDRNHFSPWSSAHYALFESGALILLFIIFVFLSPPELGVE